MKNNKIYNPEQLTHDQRAAYAKANKVKRMQEGKLTVAEKRRLKRYRKLQAKKNKK